MGKDGKDEYDLGYLFLAFSTEMFTDLQDFEEQVDHLAEEVRACPPIKPGGQVYVPGEIFGNKPVSERNQDFIGLEEDVYQRLKRMSVSLEGGYENNRLLN